MIIRGLILGGAIAIAAAGCGGGDDFDERTSCEEFLAEGDKTPDLVHPPKCTNADGEIVAYHVPQSFECANGKRLFVNEYGYGVEGEPWHTDETLTMAEDGSTVEQPSPDGPIQNAIDECQSAEG